MAATKRIIRGVQDIRTVTGKATTDRDAAVYKAYMKLSCLEMEKYRRGKERKSAMQRVVNIESRFQDIEAEKRRILESLGHPAEAVKTGAGGERIPGRVAGKFRIRY